MRSLLFGHHTLRRSVENAIFDPTIFQISPRNKDFGIGAIRKNAAWKAGGLLRDVERERGFAHSSQVVTNDTPYQDILKVAKLDRMTAHRDAEKRCHRLLRFSWKRSTVRVRPTGPGGRRADGPKTGHALTFILDHLNRADHSAIV